MLDVYSNHFDKQDAPFIVASDVMRRFMCMVERVASHTGNVLIIGETGTGKERIAQTIHTHSLRSDKPLVEVNCAALPEHLVESELFGYEKGAFSGANTNKPGLFEVAQAGTIFLDEIGELDLKVQVKLLRVLDKSPYFRLGGQRKITADVRVVAATNRDLKQEVAAGRFRRDLYHRLAQFELSVPPLRERPEDIAAIAEHTVTQLGQDVVLTPEAMQVLLGYAWPGNVRELQNVINKVVFAMNGPAIQRAHIVEELQKASQDADHVVGRPDRLRADGGELEPGETQLSAAAIRRALAETRGHRGQAAVQLGISRRTLSRKLKNYGMTPSKVDSVMPMGSLSDEERQHFRADLKVRARLLTRAGQEIICTTTNLGMSGVGVEGVHVAIASRSLLRLQFQLPGTQTPVEAEGRLAWVDKQGSAGIVFTDLSATGQQQVNAWLYQKMTEEGWTVSSESVKPTAPQYTPLSSYTN